jgi:hypothetical protein
MLEIIDGQPSIFPHAKIAQMPLMADFFRLYSLKSISNVCVLRKWRIENVELKIG